MLYIKILLVVLLCVPILSLAIYLIGKLMNEYIRMVKLRKEEKMERKQINNQPMDRRRNSAN